MEHATPLTPPSSALGGTLLKQKLYTIHDPKGPENITTLNRSTGRLFTAATQQLTTAVVKP